MLLINIPIAGVALIGARAVVADWPARRVRLDLVGACSSVAGMTALVFALAEVAHRGWTDPLVIAGLLTPRLAARDLIVPALIVMAAGMALLIGLTPGTPGLYLTRFLPAEILIGLGLGGAITPAVATATSGVDCWDSPRVGGRRFRPGHAPSSPAAASTESQARSSRLGKQRSHRRRGRYRPMPLIRIQLSDKHTARRVLELHQAGKVHHESRNAAREEVWRLGRTPAEEPVFVGITNGVPVRLIYDVKVYPETAP